MKVKKPMAVKQKIKIGTVVNELIKIGKGGRNKNFSS